MVLEIAFVLAPTNDYVSVFIGVNGLLFHAGILMLQASQAPTIWWLCPRHETARRSAFASLLSHTSQGHVC